MTHETSALLRFAFFWLTAICYMIGGWTADDEETKRHREIIFWITLVGAGCVGSLAHVLEAVSK